MRLNEVAKDRGKPGEIEGQCVRELPGLRFEIDEAAQILRMSRAQLYNRISEGAIRPQKDGARTYVSRRELERYVEACEAATHGP